MRWQWLRQSGHQILDWTCPSMPPPSESVCRVSSRYVRNSFDQPHDHACDYDRKCKLHPNRSTNASQDHLCAIAPRIRQSGRSCLNRRHGGPKVQSQQFGLVDEGGAKTGQRKQRRPCPRYVRQNPPSHRRLIGHTLPRSGARSARVYRGSLRFEKHEIDNDKTGHHEPETPDQYITHTRTTLSASRLFSCLDDPPLFLFCHLCPRWPQDYTPLVAEASK